MFEVLTHAITEAANRIRPSRKPVAPVAYSDVNWEWLAAEIVEHETTILNTLEVNEWTADDVFAVAPDATLDEWIDELQQVTAQRTLLNASNRWQVGKASRVRAYWDRKVELDARITTAALAIMWYAQEAGV